MAELVPTVNVVIDEHSSIDVEEPMHMRSSVQPIMPVEPTVQVKTETDCCTLPTKLCEPFNMQCEATELFQALAAAFAVGALTGALLYHAFSRPELME